MNHNPLSMDSDDSMEEMEPSSFWAKNKMPKTRFRLFVASMVLGIVGLAGISHFGLPLTRAPQPQFQLAPYVKFMQAFSARVLQSATHDFKGDVEVVYKETGSADPSAMSMEVELTKPAETSTEMKVVAHFKSQPGKSNDLKVNLEKIAKILIDKAKEKGLDGIEYKITAADNDIVAVEILPPPLPESGKQVQQAEKDMANSLKEFPHPKLTASITFGRTLEEMNKNLDKKVLEVFNGVMLKESAAVSTGMIAGSLEMIQADMAAQNKEVPPQVHMTMQFLIPFIKSLEAMKSRTEILYKQDTAEAYQTLPTLGQLFSMLDQSLNQMLDSLQMPDLKTLIQELPDVIDGIDKLYLTGVPDMPLDYTVKFVNFKPVKLLASFVKA